MDVAVCRYQNSFCSRPPIMGNQECALVDDEGERGLGNEKRWAKFLILTQENIQSSRKKRCNR